MKENVVPVVEGHVGDDEQEDGLQEHRDTVIEPTSGQDQGYLGLNNSQCKKIRDTMRLNQPRVKIKDT